MGIGLELQSYFANYFRLLTVLYYIQAIIWTDKAVSKPIIQIYILHTVTIRRDALY